MNCKASRMGIHSVQLWSNSYTSCISQLPALVRQELAVERNLRWATVRSAVIRITRFTTAHLDTITCRVGHALHVSGKVDQTHDAWGVVQAMSVFECQDSVQTTHRRRTFRGSSP